MKYWRIALLITCFSLPFIASAMEYTLLEPIAGFLPTRASGTIEEYLVGLFRLIIGVAGILAVIRITWCGFELMMSTSPSAREGAKTCIKMAIFGLLLAIGSFLLINSIRVGPGGGIGLQSPFTLPAIPGGAGGGAQAPVGTPVCTLSSSNVTLFEGQVTNIAATCTPGATSFLWTTSSGAPVIQGGGNFISFPAAGTYTYIVQGTNAVGTGAQSQTITITVTSRAVASCSQETPAAVTGAITCAQTNTALNWSVLGVGTRNQAVVLGNNESLAVAFTTSGAGAYGSFTTRPITAPNSITVTDPNTGVDTTYTTNLPVNLNPMKYANISKASCDFRYDNLARGVCAVSGTDITLDFQTGEGTVPMGARPGCILEPNTAYVINVRNENAVGALGNRSFDTCPARGVCEFTAELTQSAGSQFTPRAVTACTATQVAQNPGPTLNITSPLNNATTPIETVSVSFNASDAGQMTSMQFTVYSLETGTIIDSQTACTIGGSTVDTGNGIIVIPSCGSSFSDTLNLKVGSVQGSYRIEARVCGTGGMCTTQNRIVVVDRPCNGGGNLSCFDLVNTAVATGEMCSPQYGTVQTLTGPDVHGHHFRLAPGESAHLVVASRPMLACPFVSSRFTPSPPVGRGDFAIAMAPVDVFTTPGGVFVTTNPANLSGQVTSNVQNQGGYRWRQVSFNNNTAGWVYEHLLRQVGSTDPRGSIIAGNVWCSVCGMASTTVLGFCDYVRDENLHMAIATTPGDMSGSEAFLGVDSPISGTCDNLFSFGAGRFEVTVKTSGTAGPNECVIRPDRDYYMNVGIGDGPNSTAQAQEEYVVLLGTYPSSQTVFPPAPMCSVVLPPPLPPPPPPTTGGSGGLGNSIDQILADMAVNNTVHAHGGVMSWGCGPDNGGWVNNATPPSGYNALTGWGGVYRDITDSQDTNTRIAIKNFEAYTLSRSTNRWTLIQSGSLDGSTWAEDWSAPGPTPNTRTESDGSIATKLIHNYLFHFYPSTKYAIPDTSDIAGVYVTYQARMVVDNPSLPDDRSVAKYVMGSGADWWTSAGASGSGKTNIAQVMSGRHRYISNDWQSINAITLSSSINCVNSAPMTPLTPANVATIRANPPPITAVAPPPPPPPVQTGLPIIPGASGFGITTPAGSGRNLAVPNTTVYRVTNLNDSGAGSLRACAVASGPRTCIFEISGIINLSSTLEIRNPYITIAGQTAPSPGIMLTGNALTIQGSDVLVQHIRVRPGDAQPPLLYPLGDSRNLDYNNSDAIQVVGYPSPIQNVVIDHSSFGWSTDEMAQAWDNWDNVTFTNNIFANPLNDSYHNIVDTDENSGYFPHGYGPIAGGTNAGSISFVGNLFANQEGRNPLVYSPESYIANNVIYNYNGGTAVNTHPGYPLPISSSVVGNVYIPGPNTGGMLPIIMEKTASSIIRVFLSDILHPSIGSDPWAGVRYISNSTGYLGTRSEFETVLQQLLLPGFTPAPSNGVESNVLSNAGARPLDRDSVDALVIQGVRNRNGSVINCVAPDGSSRCALNAGGWPTYPVVTRALTLPANPDADDNADGYTNLENWLQAQAAALE